MFVVLAQVAVQWTGAIFVLWAGVYSFAMMVRYRRDGRPFVLWGLICFLLLVEAGELIAWGQSLPGFGDPTDTGQHTLADAAARGLGVDLAWGLGWVLIAAFVLLPLAIHKIPSFARIARRWRAPIPAIWQGALLSLGMVVVLVMRGSLFAELCRAGVSLGLLAVLVWRDNEMDGVPTGGQKATNEVEHE